MKKHVDKAVIYLVGLAVFMVAFNANAAIDNAGVLDNVLQRYQTASSSWGTVVVGYTTWLYWLLVAISMVITFGFMACAARTSASSSPSFCGLPFL